MSMHTPSPWQFKRDHCRLIYAAGRAIMGDEDYYPWCPESDADWHLIAAAPELLAMLKRCHEILEDGHWQETKAEIAALIAKAEGGTP